MAKNIDIYPSSKIDVFHSFKRFFDPDIILEFSKALGDSNLRNESVFDRMYPSVAKAEEEFHFYLSRYFFDLSDLFFVARPIFQTKLKQSLKDDINYMKARIDDKEINHSVIEQNKFVRTWFLERTGERRLSYYHRGEKEKLNSRKLQSILTDDYKDFVCFHANSFINGNNSFVNSSKVSIDNWSYFDFEIQSCISNWERFISVCKYYCDEKNFKDKKISSPPIRYDFDNNSFYWVGIGRSIIPSLAEFIRALIVNGIVKRSKAKMRIPCSFIKYFGLWDSIKDKKYLLKEMNKGSSKTFIFKKINDLN